MPVTRFDTSSRKATLTNRLWTEAEERVLAWLEAHKLTVTDVRKQRTYYDFVLDHIYTLDVKCDQWGAETGRLAWEDAISKHGTTVPGWGRHEGLDYVAYVLPGEADKQWPLFIVDAQATRRMLAVRLANQNIIGNELVPFNKQGDGWTGHGHALAIGWLRSEGCIVQEGKV